MLLPYSFNGVSITNSIYCTQTGISGDDSNVSFFVPCRDIRGSQEGSKTRSVLFIEPFNQKRLLLSHSWRRSTKTAVVSGWGERRSLQDLWSESLCLTLTERAESKENEDKLFVQYIQGLTQSLVWSSFLCGGMLKEKRTTVIFCCVLRNYTNGCLLISFSAVIWGEAVNFSSFSVLYSFFPSFFFLHRWWGWSREKACGRHLDAARFSHCCWGETLVLFSKLGLSDLMTHCSLDTGDCDHLKWLINSVYLQLKHMHWLPWVGKCDV